MGKFLIGVIIGIVALNLDGGRLYDERRPAQATADAAGVPVASFHLEGTALGNLARQFIALGAFKNLASFRQHLVATLDSTVYRPRT